MSYCKGEIGHWNGALWVCEDDTCPVHFSHSTRATEQGWIPVGERLPGKNALVVVRDESKQFGFGCMEGGELIEVSDGGLDKLVEWFPLPPSPKEKE